MPLTRAAVVPVLTLDLVLVGFGNVARRFVRLLDECADRLAADHGLRTRVVAIATARHGAVVSADGVDVARALELVEAGGRLDRGAAPVPGAVFDGAADPAGGSGPAATRPNVPTVGALAVIRAFAPAAHRSPTVVVETTTLDVRNGEPAASHVRAALEAGLHVVTANKGPVACAYRELRDLARARRRQFLFEGTVMDGIPVFNLVRETMPAVRVAGFRGVVNATTNFILARMEDGESFDAALAEMQRAGIAEADASLDVDGWDAAAKTAALCNVLLDAAIVPAAVDRTGIAGLTPERLQDARRRGRRIKLVASARLGPGGVTARVAPQELAAGDPLAGLDGMANAIELETDLLDRVTVIEGYGSLTQTAYALLTDVVAVRRALGEPAARR